jgi:hypothetical protein
VPKRLFHDTGKALPQSERAFSASQSGVNEMGEKDNRLDDRALHTYLKIGIFQTEQDVTENNGILMKLTTHIHA